MAITATATVPAIHEMIPLSGGRLVECFSITHDGASTTLTITPKMLKTIEFVSGGDWTRAITSTTSPNTVVLTWGASKSNGLLQDVMLIGRLQ